MCLAMPAQIIELRGDERAVANLGGTLREISTSLLETVNIGDYVIIHVGYALTKLNEVEAQKTLKMFEEMLTPEGKA